MPDIFAIDEVLRTFLRFCDKSTLARLARTSKLLSDPALDILWETLESFLHFLRLFPEDLITFHTMDNGMVKPTVNHLIIPRHWKRVTPYARRIRTWKSEDLSYIDEPVVDHLAFGRPPEYIMPRLQHMEVAGTSVSGVHLQTFLTCPSLETVTVWNTDPDPWASRAMNTYFRTLADRAPNLRKLIVHWGDLGLANASLQASQTPFVDGLSDIFSYQGSQLQTVNLWSPLSLDSKTFLMLSQMPNLTTLHLNLIGIHDADVLGIDIKDRTNAFPALQDVFLAGTVGAFPKILRYFGNAPDMTSLGFSVREFPLAKSLAALFTSVASTFTSLRILQFNVPKEEISMTLSTLQYISNSELYHHDINVVKPLLRLHNLVAVHLELGVPLYLTDSDLRTIGNAWQNIEVLNLCSDPFCERTRAVRPTSSVDGLLAVVSQCSSLKHLGLFVDYGAGVSEDAIAGADFASSSLVHLDVGRSWIKEPALVAALLSGVFPVLKVFQWSGMTDSGTTEDDPWEDERLESIALGHASGWRQVFDLLPVFRAVRANERRVRNSETIPPIEARMNVD